MNTKRNLLLFTLAAAILFVAGSLTSANQAFAGKPPQIDSESEPVQKVQSAASIPTVDTYTYQGQLVQNGVPYNGTCDFEVDHWDALSGGIQWDATQQIANVPVQDGLFSVVINSLSLFMGQHRWLEIAVRCPAGGGSYTILSPRQELTAAPYAQGLVPGAVILGDSSSPILAINNQNALALDLFSSQIALNAEAVGTGIIVKGGEDGILVPCSGAVGLCTADGTTNNGLEIGTTEHDGVHIISAGDDGLQIRDTGDDAIQIGDTTLGVSPPYGLYTPSPGVDNTALLVYTAQANGEWALFTTDKIAAANVTLSTITLYAQVDGSGELSPGDLVSVSGMGSPLPGSLSNIPLVRAADETQWNGVIGVVESRMELKSPPGKEDESVLSLYSADGPAKPGDYIAITVMGVAKVKVEPSATVLPGDRLTAAALAGHARPLRTEMLNGMIVAEGAPVIGIVLSPPDPETGLVYVFVTLR